MDNRTTSLDNISIAKPCSADWNAMTGTDRVRFCDHCSLNVYDLSAMTRPAAEALVREAEGRVCVRFHKRADGTMLTQDCPVGVRAVQQRVMRRVRSVAAAITTIVATLAGHSAANAQSHRMGRMIAPQPTSETLSVADTVRRVDTLVQIELPAEAPTVVDPVDAIPDESVPLGRPESSDNDDSHVYVMGIFIDSNSQPDADTGDEYYIEPDDVTDADDVTAADDVVEPHEVVVPDDVTDADDVVVPDDVIEPETTVENIDPKISMAVEK